MDNRHRLAGAPAGLLVAALVAVSLIAGPRAAIAACHIAAFTEDEQTVGEGAGSVRLVVELVGGQPTCSGSVRYETADGTARAGRDYRARSGELTFSAGDDRRETVTIPIVDDDRAERDETFTVRLSPGTQSGNISPSSEPATVTVRDDDESTPEQTEDETPEPATTTPAPPMPVGGDEGGGPPLALILAVIVAVALAGGGLAFARGRATP
ncbi:MAG TPA: Calx-beta domain-containing protein [Actinomycetota bacterium]